MTTNSNMTTTIEFINIIKTELANSTKSWKTIAQAFSDAEDQFGYSSDTFKSIMNETKFNLATATKLVKIARSDRLKRHADAFGKVHAWTVLYAVTTLTDEQFDRLLASISDGSVVTSSMVAKAKATPRQSDPYKTIFNIRIDENALRGDLFDGEDYATLTSLIQEIEKLIPYIRIDAIDRFESNVAWEMQGIQRHYDRIIKRRFREAITAYKNNSQEWQRYAKNSKGLNKPRIAIYDDAADAHASMRENPAEAFAALGSDLYDMGVIWNEASQAFAKQTAEYAAKANTEFRSTSSVATVSKSAVPAFLHTSLKQSDRKRTLKLAA